MKPIPDTENTPVLRTDFLDQPAWEKIRSEIQRPRGIFRFIAYVDFIDDAEYANLTRDQLLKLIPANYNHSFIIVVDHAAMSNPEHPLLVIDLSTTRIRNSALCHHRSRVLKTTCRSETWILKISRMRSKVMECFEAFANIDACYNEIMKAAPYTQAGLI